MQLKAFDVPRKQRRLVVRAGRTAYWGIDPSTKRVAGAVVTADGERYGAVRSIPTLVGAQRLEAIRAETIELCGELLEHGPPGVIVVEEAVGYGRRPNPELAYAVGATLCGLVAGAPFTHVEFVASAKWKLVVCGYGAVKKPPPTSREEYEVLRWAREQGYDGRSWDIADSYAIAEYARQTYALDERAA
jgi:hypothetical protein